MQVCNPPRCRFQLLAGVVAALAVAACSGGGESRVAGTLVGVSFVGFPLVPGAPASIPSLYLDEALTFTFDGPIDDGIFQGFYGPNLVPEVRMALTAAPASAGIPYYAYVDQVAARASLEINRNVAPNPPVPVQLASYIVGRHRDAPNVIVVDPRVTVANPFGLSFNPGYDPSTIYTYRIPAANAIRFGGRPALPAGADPSQYPVTIPAYSPVPALSLLFGTGAAYAPSALPLEVVSIESVSGQLPLPPADPIRVRFTRPIAPGSVDPLRNFTVRNLSLGSALVAGAIVVVPTDPSLAVFTPVPGYGPGIGAPPASGFQIEVRVGAFGNPATPPILGLPQGAMAIQVPLSTSLARVFTTAPCPGCPGASTIVETFDTTSNRDVAFLPIFNPVTWNSPSNPSQLGGIPISGNPLALFSGGLLGTRVQRVLNVTFPGGIGPGPGIPALFSPFDDAFFNNLGPSINPSGGSHLMHLYESTDLGGTQDALELIEWGAVNNFVQATTYPNYVAWCGMTTIAAPLLCVQGFPGLQATYASNYDLPTSQPADPLNPAGPLPPCPVPSIPPAVGGVRVSGPISYAVAAASTTYFPFPVFSPPFDYLGSGPGSGNLVIEQNISPGTQLANFHRYRSSAIAPVRRLIGAPRTLTPTCNSGPAISAGGDCTTYDQRFTFVGLVASGRSSFYDTGVDGNQLQYQGLSLTPAPQNQPPGTSARWELEGAHALAAPNLPSGTTTGFMTYWQGTPATGVFNPAVLNAPAPAVSLAGHRYFRFRTELRNDNVTNGRQLYTSLVMSYSF